MGFSSFVSDGWILSGWLLLVLSQSVIVIGFWLKLSINWRHNVISWAFTETKLYQHLQKQSHDFNFLIYWRGCKLIPSELYKMLNFFWFLNFKAQVAFSKPTLAKDELTYSLWLKSNSGTSWWASPCRGGRGTKEPQGSSFSLLSPAPRGLMGLWWQPVPITCSTELGAGALGRLETTSPCLSPPVVC